MRTGIAAILCARGRQFRLSRIWLVQALATAEQFSLYYQHSSAKPEHASHAAGVIAFLPFNCRSGRDHDFVWNLAGESIEVAPDSEGRHFRKEAGKTHNHPSAIVVPTLQR